MAKILCIIDGMTDPSFDVGEYPMLASFPERQFIQTVPDGFEPETLSCTLSLLGAGSPPGDIRGWIEALGAGIPVKSEDLFFRVSWVALDVNGTCTGFQDAPASIPRTEGAQYHPLDDYRGLLVMPGQAAFVTSAQLPLPFEMLGKPIADFVCPDIPGLRRVLRQSRVQGLAMLPWAASVVRTLQPFSQKSAVVCGTNVVRGIARALGMRLITSPGMTGDTDTDLSLKISTVLELAKEYPFVMLHIGGCDEAAHRRDQDGKNAFLKQVDTVVLSALLLSQHSVEVVSDHGADPVTGHHLGGMQPVFRRIRRE